jgi:hypothetical protein
MAIEAHCFYTNAFGRCEADPNTVCTHDLDCGSDDTCDGTWASFNFDIRLTPQQPTFWRVSTGRGADFLAPPCKMNQTCTCTVGMFGQISCPGFESVFAGNFVLPQGENFIGELRCYEVQSADSLAPLAANKLKGEAFIETLASGEISAYNAIAIQANAALMNGLAAPALELLLNRQNMGNGEYNACGDTVSFTSRGVDDSAPVLGTTGSSDAEVTLVSCTALFNDEAIPVFLDFVNWDQTELPASQTVDFDCFLQQRLSDETVFGGLYDVTLNQDLQFARTEIFPAQSTFCWSGTRKGESCSTDDENAVTGCPSRRRSIPTDPASAFLGCRPSPGVIGVVEEFLTVDTRPEGSAASSIYNLGDRDFDVVVSPPPQAP